MSTFDMRRMIATQLSQLQAACVGRRFEAASREVYRSRPGTGDTDPPRRLGTSPELDTAYRALRPLRITHAQHSWRPHRHLRVG